MSGQLIFPNSVDVFQLSTFTYTMNSGVFFQPNANRLCTDVGLVDTVTIPGAVTDIFLSSIVTVNSDDPITLTDLLLCAVWKNVPSFLNVTLTPRMVQLSCDKLIETGLFYTGGTGVQSFPNGVVLGPNAAALAPLMTRNETTTVYIGVPAPGVGSRQRASNAMLTMAPCLSAPGTLPAELQLYYQMATSANFLTSLNASITIENRVYGITQA